MPNRFGSPGDPIHSQPVDLLSRWKEETEREQELASQTAREPARQTDRLARARLARARQTDGRPPGGLGRPAHWLVFH